MQLLYVTVDLLFDLCISATGSVVQEDPPESHDSNHKDENADNNKDNAEPKEKHEENLAIADIESKSTLKNVSKCSPKFTSSFL